MIPRMDRLILEEVVPWFVFSVLLFSSLMFAAGEIMRIAAFLGKGVPLITVGKLILYSFPYILLLTFPMAMLLAALLGMGRLSGDSEVVALMAGGVSFERIVLPIGIFAFGVALMGFWFADAVVPWAVEGRQHIIDTFQNNVAGGATEAFSHDVTDSKGKVTLHVYIAGGFDLKTASLSNVSIVPMQNGQATGMIYARRAVWVSDTNNWTLDDAWGVGRTPAGLITVLSWPASQMLELGQPDDLKVYKRPVTEEPIRQLRKRIKFARAHREAEKVREAQVEIAQRVALPFASFVFALVGAPLGVNPPRSGKGVGFGLAVMIIFAYWVSFQFLAYLGRVGTLPPAVSVAIPNIVGLAAAIWLIRRVLR